jgi:trehalose 6-phosphate phosphatase
MRALLQGHEQNFVLLAAKMAWEIRPAGTDKGSAVRAIMEHPPFAGRLPIFVGDDVTDEDGIAAAAALGGLGLRVAEAFGEPADVRAWIARIAGRREESASF